MEHSNSQPSRDPGSLLYLLQEGLIVLDSAGIVVAVFEATAKLFGIVDLKQLLGRHFSELY